MAHHAMMGTRWSSITRRRMAQCAGVGIAATAALSLGVWSMAQTVGAQEEAILTDWAAGWSSGDPAQVTANFTEDGSYEDIPTAYVAHGANEIGTWAADYFVSVSGITQSIETWVAIPNGALVQWVVDATHTPSGNLISFRGASILELTDGKIAREIAYYDNATFITQAGGSCELPVSDATPGS